jgi:hypothetical protein
VLCGLVAQSEVGGGSAPTAEPWALSHLRRLKGACVFMRDSIIVSGQ